MSRLSDDARGGGGWRAALGALFGTLLLLHLVAIYRENVTGDEWALLARARASLQAGVLLGAGRPGLGTLILMPLVEGCRDALATIHTARWLWTPVTAAYVVAFALLLRMVVGAGDQARARVALGVGLLVLLPAFLRYSVQVRTDQAALAFGLWAGVALVGSQRKVAWAFLAGILFGVGFLISQKVVYVAALCTVLAAGRLVLHGGAQMRREALRLGLCVAGGLLALAGFDQIVSRVFEVAAPQLTRQVQSGMSAFEYYRETQGYRNYVSMLPTLVPHMITASLAWVALLSPEAREHRSELAVALAILLLGAAVLLFHAGTFGYFWLTLGLFPAAAAAVALEPIRKALPRQGMRRGLVPALWVLLIAGALPVAAGRAHDTQRVQRESFAFIDRAFGPGDAGFHPERALLCRYDPEPFPVYFSQVIRSRFSGPDSTEQIQRFVDGFVETPISFVLDSYRLDQFPQPVRKLLADAYVPYRAAVMIAGFSFVGPGTTERFEAFVPGSYRWWSRGTQATAVRVDGRVLEHGDTITLSTGPHEATWEPGGSGFLVLAVDDPPGVSLEGFYPERGPSGLFSGTPRPQGAP